jgi:protein gp37
MNKTKIEWCDFTWNPVVGCSGACPYCYARKMAHRFHRDFTPHWVDRNFERPFPKKPSLIFVNSMSDLADWQEGWRRVVWYRMVQAPEHFFLFLTKHPEVCRFSPLDNAMLGVSVTDQTSYDRLVPRIGQNTFLSIEPIHGPIKPWGSHRWIIVGAETGNRKGRVTPDAGWIEYIYEYAMDSKIPLFFKESLRSLWPFDGYDYFPQEFPGV